MNKWISNNFSKFSGSIFASRDNKVIVDGGFGFSNKENRIGNESNTRFLIGSISKMFTAVGIMKLYEDKLLDINDSVNKYLRIDNLEDDIKIVNLLNHTSGLKNYVMCRKEFDLNKENNPLEIAKGICNIKRNFKSGKKFSYNNTGYLILALVIESITKMKFEDYIKKIIFSIADMKDTDFLSTSIKERAIGYNKGEEAEIFHPSAFFGCGENISTTGDLKKFIIALNEGKIIKKELVEKMQEISASNKIFNYGYGFMIKEKSGDKSVGHGGSVPNSFSSQLTYYKNSNTIIIVLCNDVRSVKSFIPGVLVAEYMGKSIYKKCRTLT